MPPAPKSKSFLAKKIGPVPMPIALLGTALVLYLVYRHYKSRGATSGVSSSTNAPDPNAVDPNTGLTYGQEEQAGLSQIAGPPSTNGTGVGGAGGGLSVGDLEGLLSSLQGLGSTNYYYGAGVVPPTPTNPSGPGNGAIAQTPPPVLSFQTNTAPASGQPSAPNLPSPSASLSTTDTPSPNVYAYSGSGAGAVAAGTATTNYQANANSANEQFVDTSGGAGNFITPTPAQAAGTSTNQQIIAGQVASRTPPVVTPHGRAY